MNKSIGAVAGLLVILSAVGISNLSNRGPQNTPPAESPQSATPATKEELNPNDIAVPYPACTEIEQRLLRFIDDTQLHEPLRKEVAKRLPVSCYTPGQAKGNSSSLSVQSGVQFAIATVPNPVSTHLPLMFDRIVDTIEQAAQDDGFTYDDSWFPWETPGQRYAHFTDEIVAEQYRKAQQAQPGIMVFRGSATENAAQGISQTKNRRCEEHTTKDQAADKAKAEDHDAKQSTTQADKHGQASAADGNEPYHRGLVVFLVAEKPTGGIDDSEFENALLWIYQLSGLKPKCPLRILGPTFSGSLPSLQRVLDRTLVRSKLQSRDAPIQVSISDLPIEVSSGTVSSDRDENSFNNWLAQAHVNQQRSYFRTAMESDSLMVNRFCRYLNNQLYNLNRVAILSEDETAFGGTSPECHEDGGWAFSLYYPRDIATLRSAYERQSIFTSGGPEANPNAPSTTLRADLSEPMGEHDTVRSYGGALTPVAQESILLQITNQLKVKQAQFIILRSTNSLDQIFLSEFLRHNYPGGRVVIDGADRLFTRGMEGKSLNGVMLLSTYPLLTEQPGWTSTLLQPLSGAYRTFGQDISEGVYTAARELFDPERRSTVPISDYAPPAWALDAQANLDNYRPATWLTVIGHRQLWPLAVLDSYTLNAAAESPIARPATLISDTLEAVDESGKVPPSPDRGDCYEIDRGNSHPLRLPLEMWVLLVLWLIGSTAHLLLCISGSIVRAPNARAYFAPLPGWRHPVLIALGSLPLAMLAMIIGIFSFSYWWRPGGQPYYFATTGILLLLWVLSILGASLLAYISCCKVPAVSKEIAPQALSKPQCLLAGAPAILGLVLFGSVQYALDSRLTLSNRMPTYWRSVHLLSGVSPLLPQLILILGMYLWFWCNLRGLAHFGDDRPLLPGKPDLPWQMQNFSLELAGDPVEEAALPLASPKPIEKRYGVRLVVIFPITVVSCGCALGSEVRTLGERPFGCFILLWMCFCIAVILSDTVQLWLVWNELRHLLIRLDRLPLRRTLRCLTGLDWGSLWKMSGHALAQRYRVISLQFESLTHLKSILDERNDARLAQGLSPLVSEVAVLKSIDRIVAPQDFSQISKKSVFIHWYVNLPKQSRNLCVLRQIQEALASTACSVCTNILFPAWSSETDSLILGRSGCERKGDEGRATGVAGSTEKLPAHVRAAEEFFALPYLAFIQNIFGRIRTLALGIAWLFLCTTLAIASYPFQPLNVLGGIFVVVFLLVAGVMVSVFSQIYTDATLSHITKSDPGKLGWEFWMHLATFGIGPLLGLLTTLFPSISDWVFSWFQSGAPGLSK